MYVDPSGHIPNGWWNSTTNVAKVIDVLIIVVPGVKAINGYYAAKEFLKKNKNKIVYQIRRKILSMFGNVVANGLFSVVDVALTIWGTSIGDMIAKGLDYADPWWGNRYRRNNGYIYLGKEGRIIVKKINKEHRYDLKDIEEMLKPQITTLIVGTLVLFAPYGNMILKIANNDNYRLLITSLLVFPSLLLLFTFWYWYIRKWRGYKKEAKELFDEINRDMK